MSQRTADGYSEFIYQGPDMGRTFGSTLLQMERDENGKTKVQYTMGAGLEAMRRDAGGGMASGDSSFYHYNHLGTTVALTNAAESVSDTYRHDAWGVQLASTGSTINPHTYVGQQRYYRMPNASLYHLGFRDYAQGLGRFTTVDPWRSGANWFAYVGNRPSSLADPKGLSGSSPQHCEALGSALDDLAGETAKCPEDLCKTLNDQLFIYLHDCRGFSLPSGSSSGMSLPPRPDPIEDFEDIDAYNVWFEKCHSEPEPPANRPNWPPLYPIQPGLPPGTPLFPEFECFWLWVDGEVPPPPGDPGDLPAWPPFLDPIKHPYPTPPGTLPGLPGPPPGSDWRWPPGEGKPGGFWRWYCAPRKRLF